MNSFEQQVLASASLPTLPSVAQRLLGLLHDDAGIADLTDAISVDPAITAKLLRLVNSPMYGVSRRISSLHDALCYLGLNTVRSIALSFSFAEGLRADGAEDRGLDQLWRTALMTGLAARRLAAAQRQWDPEQAFVAGLLADTGALVMYDALPEHRELVGRFMRGEADLIELERTTLASDHARIGSLLLDAWSFPEPLCRLVESHHGVRPPEDPQVRLLDTAWLCARALCVEGWKHEVAGLVDRVAERSALAPAVVESILAELPGELREIACEFEIPSAEQRSYRKLLADAAEALRMIAIGADRSAYLYAAATGGGRSGFEDIRRALRPTLSTEPSTGLLQRHSMERLLEAFHVRAEQRRCPLGLMLLELEDRKAPGLEAGCDALLAELSARLQGVVRDEDELARFGVHQIAVLMPDCAADALLGAARRIRASLEVDVLELEHAPEQINLVIGVACVTPHSQRSDFGELISRVSDALTRARHAAERMSL